MIYQWSHLHPKVVVVTGLAGPTSVPQATELHWDQSWAPDGIAKNAGC